MTTLLEAITKHVIEDGDCWNWIGALQSCGATPTMRWQGTTGSVRRFVLLANGQPPNNSRKTLATYTCGNPKCVNPEHLAWAGRKAVQIRTNRERTPEAGLLRSKKIAEANRRHAKLTLEKAHQVREAEGTQRAIAKAFGISPATVSSIKTGKTWRTYTSNPFTGLGARA